MRLCPTFNSQTVRVLTNADNPTQSVGEDNLCLSDTVHKGVGKVNSLLDPLVQALLMLLQKSRG